MNPQTEAFIERCAQRIEAGLPLPTDTIAKLLDLGVDVAALSLTLQKE